MLFSIVTSVSHGSPERPSVRHKAAPAFQTRFELSSGTDADRDLIVNGPGRSAQMSVSCISIDWKTVRSS